LGGRGRWISEFEASLVYRVRSRTARATQRNPVSKNKKKKKKKELTAESAGELAQRLRALAQKTQVQLSALTWQLKTVTSHTYKQAGHRYT
jgi:hypothetical protein